MLLLVKDSPQGKKCLPPAEKSAYREEKKLLTTQRKKSLPCGEKTAYRVVVNLPYHPHCIFVTGLGTFGQISFLFVGKRWDVIDFVYVYANGSISGYGV